MDWKRIKTILICALIVINGLLVWTMYNENKPSQYRESDGINREVLLGLIEEKNIDLDEALLDFDKNIPSIELKVQSYDEASIRKVFDELSYEDNNIEKSDVIVEIGKIEYQADISNENQLSTTRLSDDIVIQQAYSFLKELGLDTTNVSLVVEGQTGKKTILKAEQKYSGFVIKNSLLKLTYNNENLLDFERVWYDVTQEKEVQRELVSTEFALFKFLSKLYSSLPNRERTLVIDDIHLVYKLREDDTIAIEGEGNIFYEIKTSSGDFLIEAAAKGE